MRLALLCYQPKSLRFMQKGSMIVRTLSKVGPPENYYSFTCEQDQQQVAVVFMRPKGRKPFALCTFPFPHHNPSKHQDVFFVNDEQQALHFFANCDGKAIVLLELVVIGTNIYAQCRAHTYSAGGGGLLRSVALPFPFKNASACWCRFPPIIMLP